MSRILVTGMSGTGKSSALQVPDIPVTRILLMPPPAARGG